MDGRQDHERWGHLLEKLDSISDSLEKMASDPQVEIEAGPALCPNCGQFNPTVTVLPTVITPSTVTWNPGQCTLVRRHWNLTLRNAKEGREQND